MSGAACAEEEETTTRSKTILTLTNGIANQIEIIQDDEEEKSLTERRLLNDKLKKVTDVLSEVYDHLT